MRGFVIGLVVVVSMKVFEAQCDNFLLWLYDGGEFLSHMARFVVAMALVNLTGVFESEKKAQTAKGDSAA